MKILQAIAYLNPKFGGDVNVCTHLSRMLAKKNHDVTIITTDLNLDSSYADNLRSEGITVIPFPCIAHLGLFLYTPSINAWLETNLKEYDIIHIHNFRSYQNNQIHSYAVKFRIPYILQAHGSVIPFSEKQNLKKLYDIVWGKKILRDATQVIALTGTESAQYQRMGVPQNKIVIIPNGIDLKSFENLPEYGKFRRSHGIQNDCKVILFVGRLHKTKGLDLLIDAFSEIIKDNIDACLIIIGPDDGYLGQLTGKIKKLNLQKKVRLSGFVSPAEKIEALIDADVFVTPSFSGFPVTFLEACACGKPIVTTINGDELDWVDGQVGYATKYDSHALKAAIVDILTDEEIQKKFAENGKNLVRSRFTWEIVAMAVEAVYRSSSSSDGNR